MPIATVITPGVSDVIFGIIGFAVVGIYLWLFWISIRWIKRLWNSSRARSWRERTSPFRKAFPTIMTFFSVAIFFIGVLSEPGPPWWVTHYTDLNPGFHSLKDFAVLINLPAYLFLIRFLVVAVLVPFTAFGYLSYALLPLLYPAELLAVIGGIWVYWYVLGRSIAYLFPQADEIVIAASRLFPRIFGRA